MMIIQVRERGGWFGGGCLGVVALAGWITAVVQDAMMVKWLWLIFDLLLAPLGAIRGFMMWLGWA